MNSTLATVTAVHNGRATLSIESPAACPRCAEGKGCGAGLFSGPRERELQLEVPGDGELAEGDRVCLELTDADMLRAAFLAYGLPLAGILLSLVLARLVLGPLSDAASVSVAVTGLLAGWLVGRKRLSSANDRDLIRPTIVRYSRECR